MHHRSKQGRWRVSPLLLLLSLSVVGYLSPAEARNAGGRAGGGHAGGPSGGAVHTRVGGGFQIGSSHQVHRGVARPGVLHQVRTPFTGLHRLHRRSSFLFSLGGFVYPSYYYYSPYPSYQPYPAYALPYAPGYPVGDYPYLYSDPVGVSSQPAPSDVVVYTAPPDPPSAPQRQPAASTPETLSPPLPLDDGSLHFEVSPGEAKIFIDGRYIGEAHELANIAEITASAGRHLLEIRVGTERTFTQVVVSPHRVTPVRLSLAAPTGAPAGLKPENGRLRVQVTPPGAAIYLDGAFAIIAESAQPVSLRLSPGQHRVQVVMPGYKGYAADVTVPEAGEAVVVVQLVQE